MQKRDLRSGGVVGLILLAVVVVLAIRAGRSEACCAESGTEGCHCSEAA